MSRDIVILNVDTGSNETREPDLSTAQPLGSLDHVLDSIIEAFPETDVSDTSWIILTRGGYSLTFNFNGRDPVQSLTISVHGDQIALEDVRHFCSSASWLGFDTSTGEYIFP